MVSKVQLVLLVCAVAYAAGNPGAGVEWRWKSRMPTVSTNFRALPIEKLVKTFQPTVRIPGFKSVAGCGPNKAETRIVGGAETTPHKYPWQVGLYIDDMFFCGGSIISEDWVMTAAHCMDGAGFVEVVAGAHNIRQNELTQVTQISTDSFVHPYWNPSTLKNDIALIRMPTPFTFNDAIAPVCLPTYSDTELPTGTLVTPSGWGLASDSAWGLSPVLREVTVPIESHEVCQSLYGSVVTYSVICINTEGGKGTCSGDSGGPLNYKSGGVSYTRGITSFGSSAGCEAGYPSGFTQVTEFLGWIELKTGIAIQP